MSDAVRKQSAAVAGMASHWELIDALRHGTDAMRKAGEKYLPRWPNEDPEAYKPRLAVATLFPAFQRTVEILSAKPFSKPLTIGEDVPTRLKQWAEDIDLEGRNLHVFAGSLCEDAIASGICGILVDYPPSKGVRTQAEEQAAGVRPYFVHIRGSQVLGWRAQRLNGAWKLMQLRLLETVTEDDGDFGEKTIEQVRVLMPGSFQIWRQKQNAAKSGMEWFLFEEGTTTLDVIPYVSVYGKRTGFMMGMPPLLELAHMNVEHWQSKSDQQNILHVSRVPILVLTGGDDQTTITVGASVATKIPAGATLSFCEHTGKAIDSGRQSILDLEDRMRQAGAELLVIKPGNITESQTLADNEQGMCAVQRIAHDLEDALDQALQYMAMWVGEPSGGHVTVFKDFGAATLAEASAEILLKMNTAGRLSNETLFGEIQRRGMIAAELNWDDEEERISEQPDALGMVPPANSPAEDAVTKALAGLQGVT